MTTTTRPVVGSLRRVEIVPSHPVEDVRAAPVSERDLVGLVRVVDDDDVAALTGRRAADRGGEAVAGRCSRTSQLLVLVAGELPVSPSRRRSALVADALEQRAVLGRPPLDSMMRRHFRLSRFDRSAA
jgi:hypothetical protein